MEELKKQEKNHAKFHTIVTSQNQKRQQQNQIDRIKWIENGILENALADLKIYNLANTFAISTERKKALKRRILLCNEELA